MLGITMSDIQQEREHLAQADRHIAEGETRVAEQIALIERMAKQGQDITLAEEFLRNLEQSLEQFRNHRQLILDALARG
jgi:hypothetical protein